MLKFGPLKIVFFVQLEVVYSFISGMSIYTVYRVFQDAQTGCEIITRETPCSEYDLAPSGQLCRGFLNICCFF